MLHRAPLSLRFADGSGLKLPRAPSPLDLLTGILDRQGMDLARQIGAPAHHAGLAPEQVPMRAAGKTVAEACARALTPRVMDELIRPLCLSALNTPIDAASAQVFLRVLHDALFGERGGADLLLPKADLGTLFPDAARRWLNERGTEVRCGARVTSLTCGAAGWQVDGEHFDRVLLACPPWDAARLCARLDRADASGLGANGRVATA